MTRHRADTQQAQKSAAAVTRITGAWFCATGQHYTKAEQLRAHGRNICAPCKARLTTISKPTKAKP